MASLTLLLITWDSSAQVHHSAMHFHQEEEITHTHTKPFLIGVNILNPELSDALERQHRLFL